MNEFIKNEENLDSVEKISEKATDMETSIFFQKHIENPCGGKTPEGREYNIREFYINLAKKELEKMENPFAKKMLEEVINKYKTNK